MRFSILLFRGSNVSGVFLDSRIMSFEVKPSYNKEVLASDPVIIFLEHFLEVSIVLQL